MTYRELAREIEKMTERSKDTQIEHNYQPLKLHWVERAEFEVYPEMRTDHEYTHRVRAHAEMAR